MHSKETARKIVAELVEKYRSQSGRLESSDYNEESLRNDFINPFFEAIGWDISNKQGKSESYRDVLQERRIIIDGRPEYPDYTFRLGGNERPLFYLEAKKPSVNIFRDNAPAYQLRFYGYRSEVAVSILTNFRQFSVYDCRVELNKDKDTVKTALIYKSDYEHYLNDGQALIQNDSEGDFDFIWNTFSKEGIEKGNLDKYIESKSSAKGFVTVDQSFLKAMEKWRKELAVSLLRTNPDITENMLNFTVQQILDRIVFLRIAEDRCIEPYGNLAKAVDTVAAGECYKNVCVLFDRAEEKYNSGLFESMHNEQPLKIENRILKTIIDGLYFPSPYAFDYIPVEFFGKVYEHFLGKTIRLTSTGRNVVIKEKEEVRKSGGVFYTPKFIVGSIVHKTIGTLCSGKTPKDVTKLKIVDPSCGSGSFLLGAYQYLIDWHTDYYRSDYQRREKEPKGLKTDTLTPGKQPSEWQLTATEKKRILLNNIFGVDIDPIACEVAKLSLLIKCMEGETRASVENTQRLFHEKVLPNIDSNIRCGNALISNDFYEQTETQFTTKEQLMINAFDWETEFPQVFSPGTCGTGKTGFDAVIGNPPYVQMTMYDYYDETQKSYFLNNYGLSMGRLNSFGFFIAKAIHLLSKTGRIGVIVPNTILTQEYYTSLRKLILSKTHIHIIESYENLVFKNAVVESVSLILTKDKNETTTHLVLCDKYFRRGYTNINQSIFNTTYNNAFLVTCSEYDFAVKKSIDSHCPLTFKNIGEINQAIALKSDRSSSLSRSKRGNNYKPVLDGREISRYQINWAGKYLRYDVNAIHSCKREDIFLSNEKIFFRRVSASLIGALDTEQYYALNTLVVFNKFDNIELDIRFILGIFNSKLADYYYRKFLKSTKKIFSEIQARSVGRIPFPPLDLTKKADKAKHGELVKLVNDILLFKEQETKAMLREKEILQRRIASIETAIDRLVEHLYGLTDEEIAIVEQG